MMNKKYIPKQQHLVTLRRISECEQEVHKSYTELESAYYGYGPTPSYHWRDQQLSWISYHQDYIDDLLAFVSKYESQQHKLQTLKKCKSKKPLGWHNIDPDEIDFDDIDSPNFFELEFINPNN
jgi:hypothetical protein